MTKEQIKQELKKLQSSEIKERYEIDGVEFNPPTRFQYATAIQRNGRNITEYSLTPSGNLRTTKGEVLPSPLSSMTPEEREEHLVKIIFGEGRVGSAVRIEPEEVFRTIDDLHTQGWEKRGYEDEEQIMSHDYFIQKQVEIGDPSIKWISGKHWPIVKKYAKLKTDYPPIVVNSEGYILDGTHRVDAAKERGDKTIMVWQGVKNKNESFRLSPEIENIYRSIIKEVKSLNEQQGQMDWDCVYIRLPQEITDQVQEWIRVNIPKEWVYEGTGDRSFGVEQESHVTLLYGLDPADCNHEKVQQKMIENSFQPLRFSLEEIGMFPSNEGYVVLKMEAQGKDLHHINSYLKNTFKNHNTYPTYNPHCTLCYIKKEHEQDIKQFIGNRIFHICEMTAKSFIYSGRGEDKYEIKLVAEQIETAKDADQPISA